MPGLVFIYYFISYDIILNKSYQAKDIISSTVTTKVKGLGYLIGTNNSDIRVFDGPDFTVPPNEFNSVFVMTNFVETRQTQGTCEEVRTTHKDLI